MYTPFQPFQPFQPFDDGQGHPQQPPCPWDPSGHVPLQAPSFFHVQGPSGYQGWGWSSTLGGNISYTQFNDNRGGHTTFWRQNGFYRFQ